MTSLAERAAQMTPKARAVLARELVRAGTPFPTDIAEPIAVVGMGCRLPGNVYGPEDFWQLLLDGRDTIREVPADRWDADAYYDPDPEASGKMTTKWGGFVDDVAGFDADFFGITPREAAAMDPQQRMLLEVSWEALEHAGVRPDSLTGSRTAAIMGLSTWDYTIVNIERRAEIDAYVSTGNPHAAAVGRIAYLLGLRGPAVAVDTACSSSLVAVHLACQSLRLRESDVALAGGVQLALSPFAAIAVSKWSALSPTGRCKTFDAGADGFVRGEGCGVLVLKRLADATAAGDRVLAVIRGSAINQDGRSNGLTAPNLLAQREVINTALKQAGVTADTVNYVETHGTGTMLGDPIEFEGLAATYGVDKGAGAGRCALGAVKTNLGHLEAAAGVAGLIKAILAVRNAYIPRNLNFTRWNPAIDPSSTRLFVPTQGTPWPGTGPRRAAVSSFGLSGTNSHVVIEQAPEATNPVAPQPDPAPAVSTLVISAKSPKRIAATAATLADWLDGPGAKTPLPDVTHTLAKHRSRYPKSGTVVARDHAEAVAGLRALAAGKPAPGVLGSRDQTPGPGTVFVYSGRGSQWVGMGRRLLADEPAFVQAIAELEPDFLAHAGFSLQEVIAEGKELVGIEQIQLGLIGMQLALTALWRSYGVRPDLVIGHSMGEVAAAVVAGALTPAEGLRVTATRARLMAPLSGQGGMALLDLDAAATEALIADYPQVTVGIYNSPQQTVISGPTEQIDELIERVRFQDRFASRVNIEVAPHNPAMDALQPAMREELADLAPRPPKIPILSTTYEDLSTRPVFDAEHWATNMRNPVRFQQAISSAASNAHQHTFIEVSAHPLLTHAITETLGGATEYLSIGTLHRDTDDTVTFHTNLAVLGRTPETTGSLADIPTTPWQHVQFWVEGRSVADLIAADAHPLLGVHVEVPSSQDHVWQADVGTAVSPWLGDHKVFGQPALPAAAYAEIALAAACEALGLPAEAVSINQLEVEQMLTLEEHTTLSTQLIRNGDNKVRIEIYSRSSGGWTRHAVAKAEPAQADDELPTTAGGQTEVSVPPGDLYAVLRQAGQHHGPAFAALTRIDRLSDGSVETEITLPDEAPKHPGYRLHPAMLDAALQSLAAAMPADGLSGSAGSSEASYLPVSFESLRLYGNPGRYARCRARLSNLDEGGTGKLGRVILTDAAGNVTAEINDIYLRSVERRSVPLPLAQKVFEASWVEQDLADAPETAQTPGSWLVLAGASTLAEQFVNGWRDDDRRVITADLADEPGVLAAFAETAGDPERPPAGVVVFVPDVSSDPEAGVTQARDLVWSISTVVRAVVGGWHGESPRLWLVTRSGLAVDGNDSGQPAVGGLRGLVRVLAYEHPELRATLVDLDAAQDLAGATATLRAELEAPESAALSTVVARRGDHRYVERLARATDTTVVAAQSDSVVRSGASYIISGGLGGLGLVVARWLVDNGAGRVVLNGRSEPAEEQRKILAELEDRAEIVVVRGDLAAPGVADQLVAAAEDGGRQLRGIVHAAAVIDDSLLYSMTRESLERVWGPKAVGAQRLHQAGAGRALDWWVGFSSTASLLGAPGQGAYACANAWLDALVDARRAAGLPAAVINWGPWSEVGMARTLANSVLDPITPAEGIEAMESLLASGRGHTGVARLRADRALIAFPEIRGHDFFSAVVQELDAAGGGDDWAGPDALRDLDPAEAARVIADQLRGRIAAVMGYADRTAVDPTQPLLDLGMDSLMAVRIRNTTRADFGVEPPVTLLLQGASLQDVTTDLMRQLNIANPEQTGGTGAGETLKSSATVRDRAQQRAAARQGAAMRRKRG
ncbi:type I polyketide synthase [Mycobacterium bourgelatii]|uniref:Phthiocerol synthesis polyketide synthase type I PpsD n=1 Tax=Mycobacterium bourgelatii TaxID=1273442 RepID=A0A7I9YME3_MYCBU|nr:type I polyketide synthase [Mycobacterium bourgelatii]MCV6977866.1 type I polyketide synthase [Mycobacterium bourgelatii]GFG89653.1 phthiocerol synthesis polyketide synthase type I PpsD [Mycobacterium bourgelatii]